MSLIKLNVTEHLLTLGSNVLITEGSCNVDTIKVEFDSSWDAYAKIVVFSKKNQLEYTVLDGNGLGPIPNEILTNDSDVAICVIGVNDLGQSTTNTIKIKIKNSLELILKEPDEDVYQQILSQYAKMIQDTSILNYKYDMLNERIDMLAEEEKENKSEFIDIVLEVGGIVGSTGAETVNNKRCRSAYIECLSKTFIVSIPEGFKIVFCYYNNKKEYIKMNPEGTWISSGEKLYEVPKGARYIRFMIASVDEVEITPDMVTEFKLCIPNDKPCFKYSGTDSSLNIYIPKARFIFKKVEKADINLSAWRLYKGELFIPKAGTYSTMWVDSDAEGVLQLAGENDAIGGYHGDEINGTAEFYINGALFDANSDAVGTFENITIICNSDVYHCESDILAHKKVKKICFTKKGYSVQNKIIAEDDLRISRGALALFQCYKKTSEGLPILYGAECDDIVEFIPTDNNDQTTYLDKSTTNVRFYTCSGIIRVTALQGHDNEYYTPQVRDFANQNRNKIYLDMFNGSTLATGDELITKFEVSFEG